MGKIKKNIGIIIVMMYIMAMTGICVIIPSTETNYGIANQVMDVRNTVVHIEKEGVCQGSGCIISEDGLIFTAKHVTDGGGNFIVTLDDGRKFETSLCVEDKEHDAAFLKIDANDLEYAKLADYKKVRVGDGIFIFGSPFGYDNFNSVSLGIMSYMQRNLDVPQDYGYGWQVTFQTDAAANPGNSGGPVFNMDGEVIGILVAGMSESVNYSVPVSVFMGNFDDIRLAFKMQRWEVQDNEVEEIMDWEPEYNHSYAP